MSDPLAQFEAWYEHAVAAGLPDQPEAMALATTTPAGVPSVRFVLLKGIDERGVEFFGNYESRKGRELAANPRAALAVLWAPLLRQVRVEGTVERLTSAESDAYFATRARGSQLGAWASAQSTPIPDREFLQARLAEADARYRGEDVPRPALLGRLPPRTGGDRVLAGPPGPPARPRGVHPRSGRRLELRPPLALVVRSARSRRASQAAPDPAAILRRSSALSSVSSSTPCSRATSRSVRPDFDASLTIAAARS